jgi:hypothetical protein
VAYKHLDARDDGNCNRLGLYIIEYIIDLIAISLDRILMGVEGGFDGGFNGGFDGGLVDQFDLAVLGYPPQQSV